MRIDISFIPKDYLNHSLQLLSNKEITNPYKRIDELQNDKKALRRFYEERSNYLRLVLQLTRLEEVLLLKHEENLAQKCKEYVNNLEKVVIL
jgi:hypothetical protein